jgi:hypothetical protein
MKRRDFLTTIAAAAVAPAGVPEVASEPLNLVANWVPPARIPPAVPGERSMDLDETIRQMVDRRQAYWDDVARMSRKFWLRKRVDY